MQSKLLEQDQTVGQEAVTPNSDTELEKFDKLYQKTV